MKILIMILLLLISTFTNAEYTVSMDYTNHITCGNYNKERYLGNLQLVPNGIVARTTEAIKILGIVEGSLTTQSMYHDLSHSLLDTLIPQVDLQCAKYPDAVLPQVIYTMVIKNYPQKVKTFK